MTTQVKQDLQHLDRFRGWQLWHSTASTLSAPPPLPNTQGLTLSLTWPESLSRRFRRYSNRHWLLPSDS